MNQGIALLIAEISKHVVLSTSARERLSGLIKTSYLSKGEFLIMEGEECSDIYFLLSGIVRHHYTTPDGRDVTSSFVLPNEFFTNVESFATGRNSTENISAIQDSSFCYLSRNAYYEVMADNHELYVASLNIINNHRVEMDRRIRLLQTLKSTEKYEMFKRTYPLLAENVQLSFIASFLGIRLETLSRLKNKRL